VTRRLGQALCGALLAFGFLSPGHAKLPLGDAPALAAGARDPAVSFRLPALRDGADAPPMEQLRQLQVGRRALALGLTSRSAVAAWRSADVTLAGARARLAATSRGPLVQFSGTRSSELNALLRDPAVHAVRVASPRLTVDETITIARRGLWLDLGTSEVRAEPGRQRFILRIEGAHGATVSGGDFRGGDWAVLVHGARAVTLRDGRFSGMARGGVVFSDAPEALLARASLSSIHGAALLVHGLSERAVALDDEIVGNIGSSNWHAGIVVSDRDARIAENPASLLRADGYGVREQRIDSRLRGPRDVVLAFNRVAHNGAAGIYADGAIGAVMVGNVVEGNAKEGICLDNGSTASVVANNLVRLNGKRWGKSDEELELDFVLSRGRLADGSAVAKTPGVSLDNALYNIVYGNQVDRNFGGGIKMVRTAFFNLVGLNVLTDNNEGASDQFHFFGIELGAARPDVPVSDLDFAPSRGNIVFANTVRGPHYAGIFYGAGSDENDAFDNTIFGATHWALEQAAPQQNRTLNNLTNLASRNVDSGLDPKLLPLAKGRYD
jgi:parallel beta-helix repeat protein